MATEAEMCKAIQSRQRIVYDCEGDHPSGEREGHPHIIFRANTGNILVHVWKTRGVQKDPGGKLPGWRLYHLSDIVLSGTDGNFTPEDSFKPQSPMYPTVICSV